MIGLVIALLGLVVAVWALCGVSGRSEEREQTLRQRRALRAANKRWRGR